MATSPVRRLLADRAYDALKTSLRSGAYPPGSFLSERQLAARLGMSKTPLKSALVRLEQEGYLRISPQQGIVVREPSIQEVSDLFDLREAIEKAKAQIFRPDWKQVFEPENVREVVEMITAPPTREAAPALRS